MGRVYDFYGKEGNAKFINADYCYSNWHQTWLFTIQIAAPIGFDAAM